MKEVWVFGSNLKGAHGKGSALEAVRKHGAIYGQGMGLQGNSYAIPTKDHKLQVLPLDIIQNHVYIFLNFATLHPEMHFTVVKIGCGLAGYKEEDIKPFFVNCPKNITLPEGW